MGPRKTMAKSGSGYSTNATTTTKYNVHNKMFELNDIVGNLFGIIKKFEYENEQLRQFINLMIHFKHMLLFERNSFSDQDEWSVRMGETVAWEFNVDLSDCAETFRRFLSNESEIFDFVKRKEISLYRKNEHYCRYDKENVVPDHHRSSSLLFSDLNLDNRQFSNVQYSNNASANNNNYSFDSSIISYNDVPSTSELKKTKKIKQFFGDTNQINNYNNNNNTQRLKVEKNNKKQLLKSGKSRLSSSKKVFKEISEDGDNNDNGDEEEEVEGDEDEDDDGEEEIDDIDAEQDDQEGQISNLAIGTEQCSLNDRRFVNSDTVLLNEVRFPVPNMSMFYRVVKRKSSATVFQCNIPKCGFSIFNSRGILGHLYRHFDLVPFKCSCCLYEHVTRKCLYRHASYHHKLDLYLFHHMDLFGTVARQNIANDNRVELKFCCKFPDCEFESFNTESLSNHLKWHLGESPFKCPVCPARFSDRNQGYHHIRRGHRSYNKRYKEESVRRCPFYPECDFLLDHANRLDLDSMLQHIEKDHRVLKKVTGVGMKFEGKKSVVQRTTKSGHLLKRRGRGRLRASKADNGDDGDDDDMVGFQMSYSCTYDDCRFQCKSVTEMKAHEMRKHRKKVYTCNHYQCELKFDKLVDKNKHIRESHFAQYICDIEGCNQSFQTGQRLNLHMKETHSEVYMTCTFCNRRFNKRKAMMRHTRLWHSIGEYKCELDPACDFVSSLRNEYDRHRKQAHPQTKLCPVEGCGKLVAVGRFNWHLRRHYNVRDKVCSWPECGKAFPDIPSLKNHLRIHLNFKRYRCTWEECGYASEQRTNVVKHIRIRHFKLPYTKREELELNLPVDPNAPKPSDFVSKLDEDVEI